MIVIFGERMYGKVDRVPGVCYVITIFAHLNFIPLIPTRSYIVIEGTEEGGEFRGKEVTISLKSAIAGYIRVWCGAVALISAVIAGFGLVGAVEALRLNALLLPLPLVVGVGTVLVLFIGGKVGAGIQVTVHLLSMVLWYVISNAAAQNPRAGAGAEEPLLALIFANLALLMYGMTRFFDHAGPARKRELLQELGVEVPPEDEPEPQQDRWEEWDESEDRRRR